MGTVPLRADARAAWLPIPTAAVVALPAYLGVDLHVAGRILFMDRAAQLFATVALGIWAARTAAAQSAVLAAGLFCLWAIFLPRGPEWPSYTWPDIVLCTTVAWAMVQLQVIQRDPAIAVAALFGLALWIADSLLMAPWCGLAINFHFTTSTACGSAIGDYRAMVPTLLTLAGWLMWLRKVGRS